MKTVEDEYHFVLECPLYNLERETMWTSFESKTRVNRLTYLTKEEKLTALLGDKFQPPVLSVRDMRDEKKRDRYNEQLKVYLAQVQPVMVFVVKAMQRRRRLEKERNGVMST